MVYVREFRATNFRSLRNLHLADLPDLVLLYGQNEAGKSNVLRALQRGLAILSSFPPEQIFEGSEFEFDNEELRTHQRRFREDVTRRESALELALTLESSAGSGQFSIRVTENSITLGQVIVGSVRVHQPISRFDSSFALLTLLTQAGFAICEAERRFLREILTFEGGGPVQAHPNGDNLKSVLFEAANSTDAELRRQYRETFLPRCSSGPFQGIEGPSPAIGLDRELALLVEEQPIECRGSGYQQWVLMNGILVFSGAEIGAIEEPEAHLSSSSQDEIARALRQTISSEAGPHQLFITSHSPLLIEASPEKIWYEVSREGDGTRIERHQDAASLSSLFPGFQPVKQPDQAMRLDLGNVLRLSDSAVRHLNARPGSYLYSSEDTEPVRALRLISAETMHDYLTETP
jgi:hypothetical protein